MADQVVSSAGNFLFVAVVARTSTVEEFGAFSLTYALYGIALGAGRALGGEILLLRAIQQPEDARAASERLLLLVAALAAAGGVGVFGVASLVDESIGAPMRALAVCLPILLLQDAIRYCLFARGEPGAALLNDSMWVVAEIAAFAAVLSLAPDAGLALLIFGWAAGAGVGVVVGLAQTRLVPRLSSHVSRGRPDSTRARSFLIEFVLSAATFHMASYLIAGVAGLAAAGAVRGAMFLFAPLATVVSGLRIVVLPALGRAAAADGSHRLWTTARTLGLALATFAVGYSIAVLALPRAVGVAILGDTWSAAEPLLLPIAIVFSAYAVGQSAINGVRALGGGRVLVWIKSFSAALLLGCLLVGAAAEGATGAAYGMAFAFSCEVVLWWIGLVRSCRVVEARAAA